MWRGREGGRQEETVLDDIRRKPIQATHHWPHCGGGIRFLTTPVSVCVCYRDSLYIHIRSLLGGKLCHISIFLPIQVKAQIKICNIETRSQTRGRRTACKTTQHTLVWRTVALQPGWNVSWVEDQTQCETTNPFLITDCPVSFCLLNFCYLRSHASKTSELNWKHLYC